MPLTPQEVASKVFGPTRLRRGYDENEVDAFLDQVEAELTRLTTENERLRTELEQAHSGQLDGESRAAAPAPPPEPAAVPEPVAPTAVAAAVAAPAPDDAAVEQRVARMLVLAQQTADAAVREAQNDAERARGSARAEADRILGEARGRAATEMGTLERSKNTLEKEVEHLQAFEREYRQRLRAYLEMQLRDLEGAANLAVEGRGATELDAGSGGGPESTEPASGADPLAGGLSDPPGFGNVWSPANGGTSNNDPLVSEPHENEGYGSGSPFDTGGEGQRSGGFGSH